MIPGKRLYPLRDGRKGRTCSEPCKKARLCLGYLPLLCRFFLGNLLTDSVKFTFRRFDEHVYYSLSLGCAHAYGLMLLRLCRTAGGIKSV